MKIIEADFDRRIDLPGVGPCPRPVDIDQAVSGFADLVSLRIYAFPAGETIHGDAEEDELFIVLLRGRAKVAIDHGGTEVASFAMNADGGTRAAFLPPDASYRLTTETATDVAYARTRPASGWQVMPAGFATTAGRLSVPDHARGMAIDLVPLARGETLTVPTGVERLVHAAMGNITVAGAEVGEWQNAALAPGDTGPIVASASADVLLVTAR